MVDPTVPPFVPVLLAAIVLPLVGRRAGHAIGIVATGLIIPYILFVPEGTHVATMLFGFDTVLFHVDQFSRLMGLVFGLIAAVAVLYSWGSDADAEQTAFALAYAGTSVGAVFAGDWLTMVFFWELMAVASTLLIWHYGGRAVRSGFRYALWHGVSGTLLLAAVVWHYVSAETFLFAAVPGGPETAGMIGPIAPALAAIGIGINVGFVGLHIWIPDTYPRPHIAASVFLCVFTTKTGVYGMYRAFPNEQLLIAYMGGAMAVFGAFMALLQDDMRRLLSYHIQSQVGYMIAGIGIGGSLATAGAFGHVFNHILYKSLLFMTVGVIIYRTGEERLGRVGGLAREMPVTAATFGVAALSIAGFPGLNGFVSKGMVMAAAHHQHLDILWYLLLLGGVGTFLSFIKLGYHAFVHGEYGGSVADANRRQSVGMVTLAGLCVLYGVYPEALYALLPGEIEYQAYTVSHLVEVLGLATAGAVGFALVKRRLKRIGHVPDLDRLYYPLSLYGMRTVVVVVTKTYAAIDRFVTGIFRSVQKVVSDPNLVVQVLFNEKERSLSSGIGASILFVAVVLVATLVFLLV